MHGLAQDLPKTEARAGSSRPILKPCSRLRLPNKADAQALPEPGASLGVEVGAIEVIAIGQERFDELGLC